MPQHLTLVSDYSFKVVHKVIKGYPIFQTEVCDPYPHLNGGQQLGALEACPSHLLHLYEMCNRMPNKNKDLLWLAAT